MASDVDPRSHLTRWRQGDRDPAAREAHNAESARLRLRHAQDAVPAPLRHIILGAVARGRSLPEACAAAGVPVAAVRGLARRDPEWRFRLTDASMAGRDKDIEHGTTSGYRYHRCRCPECRAKHHGHEVDPHSRLLRHLYEGGLTVLEIATRYNLGYRTVRHAITKTRFGSPNPHARGAATLPVDMVERYEAGATVAHLAVYAGCSELMVRRHLRAKGVRVTLGTKAGTLRSAVIPDAGDVGPRGRHLTAAEIADLLGVTRATVTAWRHRGWITSVGVGVKGATLYDFAEVCDALRPRQRIR